MIPNGEQPHGSTCIVITYAAWCESSDCTVTHKSVHGVICLHVALYVGIIPFKIKEQIGDVWKAARVRAEFAALLSG